MYKKAQAAMEFLMTYGWAILVVLIAIGALTYLVDFKSLVGNRCQLTAPLYCKSYKADSTGGTAGTGSVTLLIRNGLTQQISVDSIAVGDLCTDSVFTTATIDASDETEFEIDCAGITSGQKIKEDIKIQYDETDGLTDITTTGNLIVSVS